LSYRSLVLQDVRTSQKESELRELVITGLAHLVTANSESGFKQCLPLAYDHDTRKRMIFAHVFARVIGQGTVFDPEDKSLTKARHTSLCEVGFDFTVIRPRPLNLIIITIIIIII
jgi:neurofibromin 1